MALSAQTAAVTRHQPLDNRQPDAGSSEIVIAEQALEDSKLVDVLHAETNTLVPDRIDVFHAVFDVPLISITGLVDLALNLNALEMRFNQTWRNSARSAFAGANGPALVFATLSTLPRENFFNVLAAAHLFSGRFW